MPDGDQLILDDGWHNLRNDLTGVIGYSFELFEDRTVSHLGMWDDHDRESPLRPARGIPSEKERDQPSREGKKPRTLKSPHLIALWKRNGKSLKRITGVELQDGNPGELVGEFRYLKLNQPAFLTKGEKYLLTMTTRAGDGDHFHDPASFDGLSPLIHPKVRIIRSFLFRDGEMNRGMAIPSFADLRADHASFRIPVGPTLRFK